MLREADLYFENDFCIYTSARDPRDPLDVMPATGAIVVVVQANELLLRSVVLVAPTSLSARAASFRPEIDLLGKPTRVLVEQAGAIDASRLGGLAGRVTPEQQWGIDEALSPSSASEDRRAARQNADRAILQPHPLPGETAGQQFGPADRPATLPGCGSYREAPILLTSAKAVTGGIRCSPRSLSTWARRLALPWPAAACPALERLHRRALGAGAAVLARLCARPYWCRT